MKYFFKTTTIILFSILFSAQHSFSQIATVEKSVTGVQIGFLGMDIYNEAKLGNKFALRSQISMYPVFRGGAVYPKSVFAIFPELTLQPKYYYNIAKRVEKGKNIRNNAANYFSVQLGYIPNMLIYSNTQNLYLVNQLRFVPTFGIRRNFSQKCNFEFKVGYGYLTTVGASKNTSYGSLDLSFKVGYDF